MMANNVMRALGQPKMAMAALIAPAIANAILDPLLIFGYGPFPELGIHGAAWATVTAWTIGSVYLMYLLAYRLELISRTLPSRSVMMSSGRDMFRIGIPAAGANMMTSVAAVIMTAIAASYGDTVVAAFGVWARLEPIATLIVLAMSSSLPPLVSQNYGANRVDRIEEAYTMSLRFLLVWQLFVYALLGLGAGVIASIFSDDPEVIGTNNLFLLIMPLGYGFQGVIILTDSSLNALHKPLYAL